MRKLLMLAALYSTCLSLNAQSAISACKGSDGSINIMFDYSMNCPNLDGAKKDTLGNRDTIGFFSSADDWTTIINATAPGALKGVRMNGTAGKNSKFEVKITNPKEYYGLTSNDNIEAISFVFNDAAKNPDNEWIAEGREHDNGCSEFKVIMANLSTCTVSGTQELRKEVTAKIAPNPFSDVAYLQFNNPNNNTYTLKLVNITGQVVRSINNIQSDLVEIKRDGLTKGIYFAVLSNTEGKFLTEKIVVE